MKKILVGVLAFIAISLFATPPRTFAPYVKAETAPPKAVTIDTLVTRYAFKYSVSSAEIWRVIRCEDRSLDPLKQSTHIYYFSDPKRNIVEGTRERSYGLVQIHLPDHPDITYEQATDPEFAIEFLAKWMSKGYGWWWTCY